jgi:OPT family small oligopeptide transporter
VRADYSNTFYSSYLPILSSDVFDNTAKTYNVSRILTPQFLFDEEAYKSYSKVFMPITYVLAYGLQFAALTALVTHTACWHGKDILRQWKKVLQEPSFRRAGVGEYSPIAEPTTKPRRRRRGRRLSTVSDGEWDEIVNGDDVHIRLMRKYSECPTSWYLYTFAVMTAVGIFVVEYYPVHLPWHGLLLALAVCGVFFVPIGIVMAITNTQSSLFLVCQLICGTIFPGRPVANMVFVMYGYITSTQGLKFAADLKLGHYMKIPPRLLFTVQLVATVVGCLTQIGVLNWMFANIPRICTPEALNGFSCPIARVHFNGSILWGVVGPRRFFGNGELYRPLIWAFLIGAIAPVAIWALWRWRGAKRTSWLRSVSLPVLFGSLSWIPPATGLNFSAWAIVCYLFNWVVRERRQNWWGKYTMTLSAALDASVAFGLVIIFFGLVYPGWNWVEGFKWWGTEVYKQGCDWRGCAYREVPEGGTFGPEFGSW